MNTIDNFDKIGRKMPYTVPQGYFDGQRERLLKIADEQKPKRLTMVKRITSVAAAIAVICSCAVYFLGNDSVPAVSIDPMDAYLSSLSDEQLAQAVDIADYDIFFETDSINY